MPRLRNPRASRRRAAEILARFVDFGESPAAIASQFRVHAETVRALINGRLHRSLSRRIPSARIASGEPSETLAEGIMDRQLDLIVSHRLWGERSHPRRSKPARRGQVAQ